MDSGGRGGCVLWRCHRAGSGPGSPRWAGGQVACGGRGEYGWGRALPNARARPPVRSGEARGGREANEVRSRHATFFLAVAEEAEPELAGALQSVWVERLEGEHDNMREALSWLLERREAKLALRFGGAFW